MKYINITFGLVLIPLLFTLLVSCEEKENYMDAKALDANSRITAMDKEVAQPGDVITFTGTRLDKVYKILLNDENVPVTFEATTTELKMTIPSQAPLGDVITVSFLFSGKGVAQRVIKIISPPVIYGLSPAAAHPGDKITVQGKELYLTQKVLIGGIDVTPGYQLIDDKQFTVVMPEGSTGGTVTVVTATGGESVSPSPLILGTEVLITDFDRNGYYTSLSSNGNLDGDTKENGEFPRNNFYTFLFKDNNTSWGGNIDFYFTGVPTTFSNEKISLSIDIKTTKTMNVSVMVEGPANVFGKTLSVTTQWQTFVIPFTEMRSGYGNNGPDPVAAFATLKGVKIQPPASSTSGNFGESISIDNIKFIVKD